MNHMPVPTRIVIDSYATEAEAVKQMHARARRLRRRRVTKRYGVSVEPHRGAYWLILHDRGA